MKVRIIGDSPTAAVLAGVLLAEKQEVVWNPGADPRLKELRRRREMRLILPWGWLRTGAVQLSSSTLLKSGELGVLSRCGRGRPAGAVRGKPAGPQRAVGGRNGTLIVLDGGPWEQEEQGTERSLVPGTRVVRGLSLLEAIEWDPGWVEVTSPQPRLFVETGGRLEELQRCLKARGIAVQEVGDLAPYRNALLIRDLLDLPVALCHSTLANFLSYPEGREIAMSLLEEGLQLCAYKDLPLDRLPVLDPRDLLQRLKRGRTRDFDRARVLPDRSYGNALQHLLAGDAGSARYPHDRIVRMSAQTGIDPGWNWAVAQKTTRAIRVGFYRDPVELYGALF